MYLHVISKVKNLRLEDTGEKILYLQDVVNDCEIPARVVYKTCLPNNSKTDSLPRKNAVVVKSIRIVSG